MMEGHYQVDVYVPQRVNANPLFAKLRKEWSLAFGGTTRITGGGTYQHETEEGVAIYRIYIPASLARDEVVGYFVEMRNQLEQIFPDEKEFLVALSEGHYFI
jgi:hypothetical protein